MLLPRSYATPSSAPAGIAVLLPPDPAAVEDPDRVLDLLDGLILAGGADWTPPATARRRTRRRRAVPERDAFEIALAGRAMDADLPLLGVCRGMQLMNLARGGTLIQHLPGRPRPRGPPAGRRASFGDHDVRLAPGSLAARAAGGPSGTRPSRTTIRAWTRSERASR